MPIVLRSEVSLAWEDRMPAEVVHVRMSYCIMAHPKRVEHVSWMLRVLQGQGAQNVTVMYDRNGEGAWKNSKRAWETADSAFTHHMVLQDDISMCKDFVEAASWCATLRPDAPISFFLPRKSTEEAIAKGLCWVSTRRFLWAQAVIMPIGMAHDFLRWVSRHDDPTFGRHDDVRMAAFYAEKRLRVYVPVPTFIEHEGAEDSLMGNPNTAKRRSRQYIGDDGVAMSLPLHDLRDIQE